MTNIELLQRRAIELIIGNLEAARLEDDQGDSWRAARRLRLATDWHHCDYSLQTVMREIYFFELVNWLDSIEQILDDYGDEYEYNAEDILHEFEIVEMATDNSFIAPVLLLSASLLDWQEITRQCQDLFFSPELMGRFTQTAEAVIHYAEQLELVRDLADSVNYGDDD